MESQPKNPEFRSNPENFHPCISKGHRLELPNKNVIQSLNIVFLS